MHKFAITPIDAEKLVNVTTLRGFVKAAHEIAGTSEAIEAFETGNYKEYEDGQKGVLTGWSPKYFGGAIEFLAETYFQHFGGAYNLEGIRSTDDFDSTEVDGGIDHEAKTTKTLNNTFFTKSRRRPQKGSPVYIQTKGTTNFNKTYKTNDGARLPNFFMRGFSKAIQTGQAYQARYIIFTTGKDIHYLLDNNSGNNVEVVNSKAISKRIDGNQDFFNALRVKLGLPEESLPPSPVDPEFAHYFSDGAN